MSKQCESYESCSRLLLSQLYSDLVLDHSGRAQTASINFSFLITFQTVGIWKWCYANVTTKPEADWLKFNWFWPALKRCMFCIYGSENWLKNARSDLWAWEFWTRKLEMPLYIHIHRLFVDNGRLIVRFHTVYIVFFVNDIFYFYCLVLNVF